MDMPVIFSAPMVRALLDCRKTMTRHVAWHVCGPKAKRYAAPRGGDISPRWLRPSVWQRAEPGDRLWVREATRRISAGPGCARGVVYLADAPDEVVFIQKPTDAKDLKPIGPTVSIHMPRWVSRFTLVVTGTKTERLQAISDADAMAEGIVWSDRWGAFIVPGIEHPAKDFPVLSRPTPREMFAALWDVIHGPGAWLADPEVVAPSFIVHRSNIDAMEAA